MLEFFTSLNDHNLPYPDTIHPIVVHFVIAMVLFSFFCDVIGYFTGKANLFEVSWWNMLVATIAIFVAELVEYVSCHDRNLRSNPFWSV